MFSQVRYLTLIQVLLCATAGAGSAMADTYIRQVMRTAPVTIGDQTMPGSSDTAIAWLSTDHAYQDHGDGTASLYVMADSALYLIDHDNRSIFRVHMEQALGQLLASSMEDPSQADPGAPKEERAAKDDVNRQMDSLAKAILAVSKFSVERTEEAKPIGPWNTVKYNVDISMAEMSSRSEVWATEAAPEAARAFQRLSYAQMANSPVFAQLMKELDKVEGITVFSTSKMQIMGVVVTLETEVLEMEERTAPEGIYDLPKDYEIKSGE